MSSTPRDNSDALLVLPPQISLQYKQLKIHVIEAMNLPDMDYSVFKKAYNECDGLIQFEIMGTKLRTSIHKMEMNLVKWKETVFVNIILICRFLLSIQ